MHALQENPLLYSSPFIFQEAKKYRIDISFQRTQNMKKFTLRQVVIVVIVLAVFFAFYTLLDRYGLSFFGVNFY